MTDSENEISVLETRIYQTKEINKLLQVAISQGYQKTLTKIKHVKHETGHILLDVDDPDFGATYEFLMLLYMDASYKLKDNKRSDVPLSQVAEEQNKWAELIGDDFIECCLDRLEDSVEILSEALEHRVFTKEKIINAFQELLNKWKRSTRMFFNNDGVNIKISDPGNKPLEVSVMLPNKTFDEFLDVTDTHLPISPMYQHGVLSWEKRIETFRELEPKSLLTGEEVLEPVED